MAIELTERSRAIVSEMLANGDFKNESEVIEHVLIRGEVEERIKASLREALASLDRGKGIELTPEVWDEIDREADEIVSLGLPIDPDVRSESSQTRLVIEGAN
jgi:hypothetical protein